MSGGLQDLGLGPVGVPADDGETAELEAIPYPQTAIRMLDGQGGMIELTDVVSDAVMTVALKLALGQSSPVRKITAPMPGALRTHRYCPACRVAWPVAQIQSVHLLGCSEPASEDAAIITFHPVPVVPNGDH